MTSGLIINKKNNYQHVLIQASMRNSKNKAYSSRERKKNVAFITRHGPSVCPSEKPIKNRILQEMVSLSKRLQVKTLCKLELFFIQRRVEETLWVFFFLQIAYLSIQLLRPIIFQIMWRTTHLWHNKRSIAEQINYNQHWCDRWQIRMPTEWRKESLRKLFLLL